METIYNIIQSNPDYFAWAFGIVNALWLVFVYFNNKSHGRAIEALKYNFSLKAAEGIPLIKKLQELEGLAGETKEVATSYKTTEQKWEYHSHAYEKLEKFAGQFSTDPKLMHAIRDLNQYCAIMAEKDPHESCREDVQKYYNILVAETERVRLAIRV